MFVKAINWIIKVIKVFLINFLLLYLFLFLIELFFQIKNGTLFLESKYIHRDKLENKLDQEVHLSYAPYKMIKTNESIFPLSGISNVKTIFCREEKEYYTYFSDKYGFNNQGDLGTKNTLLIGDSYVQGLCVEPKFSLANNLNAISFGFFANGPLIEYATFREYQHKYDFEKVVWFFTIDNDFYDFSKEIQDQTLNTYLKDKNYTQNLVDRDDDKNQLIKNVYFDYESRNIKEKIKHYHLDIKYIRQSISKFIESFEYEGNQNIFRTNEMNYYEDYVSEIGSILIDLNNQLKIDKKSFLVVFHAIHPTYKYHNNDKILKNHYDKMNIGVNKLIEVLELNNINFYNFNDYVYDNYNKNNIDQVFKKVDMGYDHYSINGNKILSEKVLEIMGK